MFNKYFLLPLFPILIVFSCRKPPDYSDIPKIDYLSISTEQIFDEDNLAFVDSVSISIRFEDGNGDLGLDNSDIENSEVFVNDFVFNYFIDVYKKTNGNWEFIDFEEIGSSPFYARFPRLLPEGLSPIDGSLNFALTLVPSSLLKSNDTLRFDVYIVDRELNRSNTVTTEEITFGIP